MAFAIPLIGLAGGVIQGAQQSNAMEANATTYAQEGKIAAAQGYEAESAQRRQGSEAIGRATAAAGQSGGGYQGSTGLAIGQSAQNAEHDALSIRYKSLLQKWGFDAQSKNLKEEAQTVSTAGFLKGGASLLKGYSNYASAGVDLG